MVSTIDTDILQNVKRLSKGISARCPACAAIGEDKSGNHLFVGDSGFCCIKYKGDKDHSRAILEFLKNNGAVAEDFYIKPATAEIIRCPKIWDNKLLDKLLKYDDYWHKRGISSETLRLFKAGYSPKGNFEMSSRYVFPIFNNKNAICGWAGRATWKMTEQEMKDKNIPKWKLMGDKNHWVYPLMSHQHIIEAGSVIIVEGISDILYLYEHGYKNCICLFGTAPLHGSLKYLISLTKAKIVIALNNEESEVGNKCSEKIYNHLLNFFDSKRLVIKLPPKKDFALCSKQELNEYFSCL